MSIVTFFRTYKTLFLSILFLVVFSFAVAHAMPPSSPYNPNQTLDPNCGPTDTNCFVNPSVSFSNITNTPTTLAGYGITDGGANAPLTGYTAGTSKATVTSSDTIEQGIQKLDGNIAGKQTNLNLINVKDYGAVGNGSHDDYAAILAAVTAAGYNQTVVIPDGTYYLSQPLDLSVFGTVKNLNLIIYGNLQFSGTDGIIAGGNFSNPFQKTTITMYGYLDGGNSTAHGSTYSAYTGSGLTIKNAFYGTFNMYGQITDWQNGINMEAVGPTYTGTSWNVVNIREVQQDAVAILLTTSGAATNYVAENDFYNGNLGGQDGIDFVKGTNQTSRFQSNKFYSVAVEPVTRYGINLDFASNNIFQNGRLIEAENPGATLITLSSTTDGNEFIGYNIKNADINDTGTFNQFGNSNVLDHTTNANVNLFYNPVTQSESIGPTDQYAYPYFEPNANIDLRGTEQIRQKASYGDTTTATYLYIGPSNEISDNNLPKGVAFRYSVPTTDTAGKFIISEYAGFASGSETASYSVPTTSLTDVFIISNKKVGIMNSSPSHTLDVTGNGAFSTSLSVGTASVVTGTTVATFTNAGGTCNIVPSTSGGVTCSSDMNLKKNIDLLADDSPWSFDNNVTVGNQTVLQKVLDLKPVAYNWDVESDSDPKHAGFIAQDVQKLFPDLVSVDPNTNYLSLSYTGLVPYTVEAIKELNIEITNIDDLSKDNDVRTALLTWFSDTKNTISTFVANTLQAQNEVCIQDQCLTKDDFERIIQQRAQSGSGTTTTTSDTSSSNTSSDNINTPAPTNTDTGSTESPEVSQGDTTPPVVSSHQNDTQSPDTTSNTVSTPTQ